MRTLCLLPAHFHGLPAKCPGRTQALAQTIWALCSSAVNSLLTVLSMCQSERLTISFPGRHKTLSFFPNYYANLLLALNSLHKRHITDEVMANHLNGLHISQDYTTHQQACSSASWEDAMSIEPEPSTSAESTHSSSYITMSTQDLEQKLKNANSITICEQISKMQNEPVLPQSLIDRIERPCLAVVLWQSPMRGTCPVAGPSRDCIIEKNNSNGMDSKLDDDCIVDDLLDNNNSSAVDLNSSMDMDL